ncbi:PTS sugar transporter subunit IIA [Pectinatus brassicae]|uniref:PTS system N-acetylgalactosamine-specific IIA component n=1 Tax=Pectinatus brassicae TaxID=862415 RepID=A0A840UQA9_9FIRM|nr:PTS fructose transporter subunit IIA [Pectinatus brassicae]MBB5335014.1 PTS system N-acetylgalactosamine-specific IIA component [Pectinatus brassicae]
MLYVIMVSHGEFAPGLHTAVKMIAGDRENVLSTSLKDGMSADEYGDEFKKIIAPITSEDKIVLLADIVGGSPLTTAVNILNEKGLLINTKSFGGMNLPMALTVVLNEESFFAAASKELVQEGQNGIQEFKLEDEEDDDI